jgi:hypothetical protein
MAVSSDKLDRPLDVSNKGPIFDLFYATTVTIADEGLMFYGCTMAQSFACNMLKMGMNLPLIYFKVRDMCFVCLQENSNVPIRIDLKLQTWLYRKIPYSDDMSYCHCVMFGSRTMSDVPGRYLLDIFQSRTFVLYEIDDVPTLAFYNCVFYRQFANQISDGAKLKVVKLALCPAEIHYRNDPEYEVTVDVSLLSVADVTMQRLVFGK